MSPRRQPDGQPEWRSVDELLAQVRAALPPLTPLPADLAERLDHYYKAARPSLWRRL